MQKPGQSAKGTIKQGKTGEAWPWSAYTIAEFCQEYRISRSDLYRMWERGTGPRRKRKGQRGWIITVEAARAWTTDDEKPAAKAR